jgi:hypothetical protein
METVRLSDYSSYDKNKGGIQKLRHKFRNQILEYWGEDTGILIGTTMVYERHLWNEEVKVMIMDDNKIMEAAKLIANSSAALIEAMGMMSENIERANRGESLAYTEEAFNKVVMNNGIDYNSVMSRSWI